jgi:hypothetical protein
MTRFLGLAADFRHSVYNFRIFDWESAHTTVAEQSVASKHLI